jgi:hypothetical protein
MNFLEISYMIDIFSDNILDLKKITCHSGGASGADSTWEKIGEEYGVKTRAYSYKTQSHQSPNKVEISDDDYREGVIEVNRSNKWLNRYGIHKYMNLLARNWPQVKYSKQIFAIGQIIDVGEKSPKGYYNRGKYAVVDGGTGYSTQMAINYNKPIFVFDQIKDSWFRWSYSSMSFIKMSIVPKIECQDFAGIGTRELQENGLNQIRKVYELTFNK